MYLSLSKSFYPPLCFIQCMSSHGHESASFIAKKQQQPNACVVYTHVVYSAVCLRKFSVYTVLVGRPSVPGLLPSDAETHMARLFCGCMHGSTPHFSMHISILYSPWGLPRGLSLGPWDTLSPGKSGMGSNIFPPPPHLVCPSARRRSTLGSWRSV